MPVRAPGEGMETHEFEVVGQAFLVIEEVFKHEPGIDDVTRIGGGGSLTAWRGIGVKHAAADPKWPEILPKCEPFREAQLPKPG